MFKLKDSLPTQDLKNLFTDYSSGKMDFNQLSSYIDNCASSTNSLNSAIESTTVGSTLLTSVLNAGIFATITVAINTLSKVWDNMNVTLAEVQANIDSLKSKISDLQNTRISLILDINNGTGDKADLQNQLENVNNQIQYDKESLAVQEKEYDQNLVGTSWTDLFDGDSLKHKAFAENYNILDSESFATIAPQAENLINFSESLTDQIKEAEEVLNDPSLEGRDRSNAQDHLNDLKVQAGYNLDNLQKHYDTLLKKRATYNEYLMQAQQAIDNGNLTGDDLQTAIDQRDEWQSKLDATTEYMDKLKEAQKEAALLKFDNLKTEDLNKFDDQQLEILTTLDLDSSSTPDQIKAAIEKVQAEADQESVSVGLSVEENESIDNYQATVDKLGEALKKYQSGNMDKSDIGQLVREFPTLEGHAEDLSSAIEELIDNQLNSLMEILGEDTPPEIIDWLKEIADEARNAAEPLGGISDKISGLTNLKGGMSSLGEAYNALIENADGLSLDNYSALEGTFGELEGFESFLNVISDSSSSIEEIEASFNSLTDEYIRQQGILDDLNLSNAEFVENQLTELGILNANEVVLSALGLSQEQYAQIKSYCNEQGIDMANITAAEAIALSQESNLSYEAQQALYALSLQKILANDTSLNTDSDIQNLMNLVSTLGGTTSAIQTYQSALKNHWTGLSQADYDQLEQNARDEAKQAYDSYTKNKKPVYQPAKIDFSQNGNFLKTFNNAAKSAGDSVKNTTDAVKDAAAEAKKALDELIKKFDELEKGHDLRLSLFTDRDDKIQDAIKLLESQGNLVGKAFYEELINSQNKQIQILTQKRSDLENYLNESVSSGKIEVGTEQWFKMTQAVEDTKDEIMKCTTNVEDFQNKINELHWKQFDKFIDRLEGLDSEISNITDILSKKDLVEEDTGEWTKEGLTSLAMYGEAYELAIFRAQQYSQEIQNLSEAYQRGEYSTLEYQEKLQELQDKQWDSIKASQAAKEGIIELNKTRVDAIKKGIEKEISATEELINKKKEALDIEKDAHDFQESVAERQEEIYKLQRQLNGLSTDSSQEAAAKRKKIQTQLTKAQKELDELYYDESIEQQKTALDTELENYKTDQENKITLLEESLANEEQIISDSLQTVQLNHQTVYATLTQLGNDYGLQLSSAIVTPWINSENALSSFSTVFDEKRSHFTEQLGIIKNDFEQLGGKADETASKVLSMLSQIDQAYRSMEASANAAREAANAAGGSTGSGSNNSSNSSDRYQVLSNIGTVVEESVPYKETEQYAKYPGTYHIRKLAKGTRHATAGLALVNELGPEAIFSKTPTGSFHLMNEGDQVFTKQQTDNLYRLSTAAPSLLLSALTAPALPGVGDIIKQQSNSPTNIDIKCPVYIQGSVDNQNIQKIQKQIDSSILKAVGKLNHTLYKSGARKA